MTKNSYGAQRQLLVDIQPEEIRPRQHRNLLAIVNDEEENWPMEEVVKASESLGDPRWVDQLYRNLAEIAEGYSADGKESADAKMSNRYAAALLARQEGDGQANAMPRFDKRLGARSRLTYSPYLKYFGRNSHFQKRPGGRVFSSSSPWQYFYGGTKYRRGDESLSLYPSDDDDDVFNYPDVEKSEDRIKKLGARFIPFRYYNPYAEYPHY
ncbi:unnamed protein product [Soboliphyme baturini]|uniref:Neuropeptide-like 1 n=1 Tax=Soboliphyme baturini TaxID=241478 RepID=A0A183IV11_9BILA|nr:unnamed protein product [Soboliphyme baturini]